MMYGTNLMFGTNLKLHWNYVRMAMTKKNIILILGILGWLLSYFLFTKWLIANGWDFFGGWHEAFTSSDFATGLLLDLVVVTIMMIVIALWERERLGVKWTTAIIASLALSVSVSLALYLIAIWQKKDEGNC